MKKIFSKIIILISLFASVLGSGCEQEELSHTQVTPVKDLYAPEDNAFFNLNAQSSAIFEWEQAKAEDNGVVLYEVVFDKEGGDFSDPVYTVPSDGKGLQPTLTLSFSDLNKIAEMAGIQSASTGKLIWTVLSSKGINVQPSMVSRTIEVERPAGFPPPAELYLSGTATEVGDDLSKAILMKKTSPSTFEVYTSLKEGEYYFAERNSGEPTTYSIQGDKLVKGGKTTVTGEEKVYRIRLDFSNGTTEIAEIETLELFMAASQELFEIPYAGNGTWEIKDTPIEFVEVSWEPGLDERYKFVFKVKNEEGAIVEEWYGSVNKDNQNPTEDTPDAFWNMVPVTYSDWDNSFKYRKDLHGKIADIKVIFNATVPAYTHTVTPK